MVNMEIIILTICTLASWCLHSVQCYVDMYILLELGGMAVEGISALSLSHTSDRTDAFLI